MCGPQLRQVQKLSNFNQDFEGCSLEYTTFLSTCNLNHSCEKKNRQKLRFFFSRKPTCQGEEGEAHRQLRFGRFFTTKLQWKLHPFPSRNLSVRTLYNYYIYLNIVGTTPGRGYTCPATDEISRWTGAAIDSTKKSYMASGRGGNVWLDEPQVSECLKSSKLEVVF